MRNITEYIVEKQSTLYNELLQDGFSDNEIKALEFVYKYSTSDCLDITMFDGKEHYAKKCMNRDADQSKNPFPNKRMLSGYLSSVRKKAAKMKCPYLGYWRDTSGSKDIPYYAKEEWYFDTKKFKEWDK